MLNKLITLFVPSKIKSGFSTAQLFLDGKKAYIAGAILILQALLTMIEQICALNGLSEFIGWLKELGNNGALEQFGIGLGMIGLRHATAKASSESEAPAEK